jgi:hypothetical protein
VFFDVEADASLSLFPASIANRRVLRHIRSPPGAWRCAGRHDLLMRFSNSSRMRSPMPFERNITTTSLLFALAALLPAALSANGALAGYPDRLVKIVVPFAPGGGTDVIARTLAQEMAKDLGATVIIENKPGRGRSSVPRPSQPASRMATRC